jgi:hypothetical protein
MLDVFIKHLHAYEPSKQRRTGGSP